MHEVLLCGWRSPFGDFFWLEDLENQCINEKRWASFLTSEPCHVKYLSPSWKSLLMLTDCWRCSESRRSTGQLLVFQDDDGAGTLR